MNRIDTDFLFCFVKPLQTSHLKHAINPDSLHLNYKNIFKEIISQTTNCPSGRVSFPGDKKADLKYKQIFTVMQQKRSKVHHSHHTKDPQCFL